MSGCRYDHDASDYLRDGEPCRRDDYGDPTVHCTARRTCAQHIGRDELTCARCLSRTRTDLRWIAPLADIMPTEAEADGVDSEAANLAGPAADVQAWTWRKIAARQGGTWHASLIEDDDELHPYTVLTRWQMMLAEDYGHPLPDRLTTRGAAEYLDRILHLVAQDPVQDFPLLGRELRKCRQHLEATAHNSTKPDRGAPCPECTSEETGVGPRLVRQYGHWCWDDDCERLHYLDDSADAWVCPRDREHWWTHDAYERWIEERHTHNQETA